MQYFRHEDVDDPGKFATWTCTIEFDISDADQMYTSKSDVKLRYYYGAEDWSA